MTTIVHLVSLSSKITLLGGIAWLQLSLLRRAPAVSRRRLCSMALIAILLLAAGEMLAPDWMVKAPVFHFTTASARTVMPAAAKVPAGSILTLLWMVGAAYLLLRAVIGRIGLMVVRRRSNGFGQIDGVDVRLARVQTPILSGWVRPMVLLPEAARAWTEEQRGMVLTHELTHFRQGDVWTNLLAQVLRAAFWFHPVVWWLVSRLSREQELTCDEAVVASGHSRHDYAAFLLDTVRDLQSSELLACAMAGSGARSLKERFANLLEPMPRPLLTRRIVLSLASLAVVALVLTAVRPGWSQNEIGGTRQVYRVGGEVTSPEVLTKIEPKYSDAARGAKISGAVHVSLVITPEGKPESIEVTDGLGYGLDENAIDAISQWTFQPATKGGKAVATTAQVLVNYRLL